MVRNRARSAHPGDACARAACETRACACACSKQPLLFLPRWLAVPCLRCLPTQLACSAWAGRYSPVYVERMLEEMKRSKVRGGVGGVGGGRWKAKGKGREKERSKGGGRGGGAGAGGGVVT